MTSHHLATTRVAQRKKSKKINLLIKSGQNSKRYFNKTSSPKKTSVFWTSQQLVRLLDQVNKRKKKFLQKKNQQPKRQQRCRIFNLLRANQSLSSSTTMRTDQILTRCSLSGPTTHRIQINQLSFQTGSLERLGVQPMKSNQLILLISKQTEYRSLGKL